MKFNLKQHATNLYPKGALLIQGESPSVWLEELQKLGFALNEITAYPIPSLVVNQLYGCLIVYKNIANGINIGKNRYFQNCHNRLFIPENTRIVPAFAEAEWESVFAEGPHIYHPDFGLVVLNEPINWLELLNTAVQINPEIHLPTKGVFIPKSITSLQIAVDEEGLLKQLENPISDEQALAQLPFEMKKVLQGNQREMDKYLKFLDENPEMALKYAIPLDVLNTSRASQNGKFKFRNTIGNRLTNFFNNRKNTSTYNGSASGEGVFSGSGTNESWLSTDTFKFLLRIVFFLFLFGRAISMSSGTMLGILKVLFFGAIGIGVLYFIYKFFKNRENRSFNEPSRSTNFGEQTSYPGGRHVGSSVPTNDLFKYLPVIIVLLIVGFSFGFVQFISSDLVDFSISPIFYILAFFVIVLFVIFLVVKLLDKIQSSQQGNANRVGANVLLDTNRFSSLLQRYEKLALDFVDKKEYEKASHVYRKLLQNNVAAAQVLERGALYQEAAVTYLKLCQNKEKASECFEKGRSYREAIELYKEMDQKEKVGDLYLLLHQKDQADLYFNKVVDEYKTNNQFVKASLILRNKVKNTTVAQEMLLEGWRTDRDASNCLNNYFVNVPEIKNLQKEIRRIYDTETNDKNVESFLQLLKVEFKKDPALETLTRTIAYEIVAAKIEKKPEISTDLLTFNKGNTSLSKDIMRYKMNIKKTI